MRGALPRLLKVMAPELAAARDYGRAHGAILMRSLRPCQAGGSVDPQREPHCHNGLMPTEKELLDRIHYLEEQNSVLQDKLDMIYAILAPDFEEVEGNDGGRDDDETGEHLVQIRKPD
jgi:hypothetical protein